MSTGPTKPVPAKKGLFNRPKWAAASTSRTTASAPRATTDDFFSRANETLAAFAAEEEEHEREVEGIRKPTSKKKPPTPPPSGNEQPRSPKRRRVSGEDDPYKEADTNGRSKRGKSKERLPLESTQSSGLLVESCDAADNDMPQNVVREPSMPPPSPSKLPADVPRIPNDEQCEHIRSKNPKLEACSNSKIRQLALLKWERNHERLTQSPQARNSPSKQLQTTPRRKPSLRSQSPSLGQSPTPIRTRNGLQSAVISLDDDDNEPTSTLTTPPAPLFQAPSKASNAQATIEIPDDSPLDNELAEIERRARDRARRERLLKDNVLSPSSVSDATGGSQITSPPIEGSAQSDKSVDPVIQLFITSEIPGTSPLIICRKLSQRFKEVREYWCNANKMSEEVKAKVSLTWKKRRLYDSQNCKRLGFDVGDDGGIVYKNDGEDDLLDDYDGKIVLVAIAEGIAGAPELNAAPPQEATQQPPAVETSSEQEIRVIIRAKDWPECKLIVKPTTAISRIINAFRSNGKIPVDKNIALMFDGELLQPNSQISQADIGDMEHIDAYVR